MNLCNQVAKDFRKTKPQDALFVTCAKLKKTKGRFWVFHSFRRYTEVRIYFKLESAIWLLFEFLLVAMIQNTLKFDLKTK